MKDKNLNYIAATEKAIAEKYGDEAVANPRSNWTDEKEKEYLSQMKELYQKVKKNEEWQEKVDINGIKVTKKLLNRESLKYCSTCGTYPKVSMDDVCLVKFDCCSRCYYQYVEGREERWLKGWRPKNENK
jgi:ribosomal protein L4